MSLPTHASEGGRGGGRSPSHLVRDILNRNSSTHQAAEAALSAHGRPATWQGGGGWGEGRGAVKSGNFLYGTERTYMGESESESSQRTATHCNALQRTTTHHNTLQRIAISTLVQILI